MWLTLANRVCSSSKALFRVHISIKPIGSAGAFNTLYFRLKSMDSTNASNFPLMSSLNCVIESSVRGSKSSIRSRTIRLTRFSNRLKLFHKFDHNQNYYIYLGLIELTCFHRVYQALQTLLESVNHQLLDSDHLSVNRIKSIMSFIFQMFTYQNLPRNSLPSFDLLRALPADGTAPPLLLPIHLPAEAVSSR